MPHTCVSLLSPSIPAPNTLLEVMNPVHPFLSVLTQRESIEMSDGSCSHPSLLPMIPTAWHPFLTMTLTHTQPPGSPCCPQRRLCSAAVAERLGVLFSPGCPGIMPWLNLGLPCLKFPSMTAPPNSLLCFCLPLLSFTTN